MTVQVQNAIIINAEGKDAEILKESVKSNSGLIQILGTNSVGFLMASRPGENRFMLRSVKYNSDLPLDDNDKININELLNMRQGINEEENYEDE